MKITVYIASPYRIGNKLNNVRRQIDAAEELLKHGFAPHVPLLNHYWDEIYPHDDEEWLNLDLELLPMFDCVLRLEGESYGADKEVQMAKYFGIPVFYDIKELIRFYKQLNN